LAAKWGKLEALQKVLDWAKNKKKTNIKGDINCYYARQ